MAAGTSSDQTGVLEESAAEILKRATDLDRQKRYPEASVCYQEGLQLLLNAIKATANEQKKKGLRQAALQYMDRAEKIKDAAENQKEGEDLLENEENNFDHTEILIENDSTGHSYSTIFGPYLNDQVHIVEIEDPYIRSPHQIYNFLRFCELLVKFCENLKGIHLTTTLDNDKAQQTVQVQRLNDIRRSLHKYHINLTIKMSEVLHDREIRLSNGWTIKIGRGLDYFKAPDEKFSIGYCDYDFRHCHQTKVDIFRSVENRAFRSHR